MRVKAWVARHRLASAIAAGCAVLIAVLSVVTSGASPATSATDPKASAFSLPMLSGSGRITLSEYSGKPVILNFWASWCTDCKKETSLLVQFERELSGRVPLIGVDESDTTSDAVKYARVHGITYPLVTDANYAAADAYGIYMGIPQTVFISANRRIVDRILGAATPADLAKGLRAIGVKGVALTG
jgi:cytochrome c biogenesis protein CcmG/thiol:disulfide interchange protein DsbE